MYRNSLTNIWLDTLEKSKNAPYIQPSIVYPHLPDLDLLPLYPKTTIEVNMMDTFTRR